MSNYDFDSPEAINNGMMSRSACDRFTNDYISLQYHSIRDSWTLLSSNDIIRCKKLEKPEHGVVVNLENSEYIFNDGGLSGSIADDIDDYIMLMYNDMQSLYSYLGRIIDFIRTNVSLLYEEHHKILLLSNTDNSIRSYYMSPDDVCRVISSAGLWVKSSEDDSDTIDYKSIYKYLANNNISDYSTDHRETFDIAITHNSLNSYGTKNSYNVTCIQDIEKKENINTISMDELENKLLSSGYHLERCDQNTLLFINDFV